MATGNDQKANKNLNKADKESEKQTKDLGRRLVIRNRGRESRLAMVTTSMWVDTAGGWKN